ncbi:MAG: hypothetical protein V2I43_22590, partial [Parvularcula sp.]|nr:hypothetical protein [Parvularcula sp.]
RPLRRAGRYRFPIIPRSPPLVSSATSASASGRDSRVGAAYPGQGELPIADCSSVPLPPFVSSDNWHHDRVSVRTLRPEAAFFWPALARRDPIDGGGRRTPSLCNAPHSIRKRMPRS